MPVLYTAAGAPVVIASELGSMRETVAAHLPDTCTISTPGQPVLDKNTGTYTNPAGAPVYSGPCRVRPAGQRGDLVVQAGGEPVTFRTYDATIPWDAAGVEVDHILTLTTSADPSLVGRPLRVRDVQYGSWQLGRRLTLEDDLG